MKITTVQPTGRTLMERTAASITLTSTPVRWDTWYMAPIRASCPLHLNVSNRTNLISVAPVKEERTQVHTRYSAPRHSSGGPSLREHVSRVAEAIKSGRYVSWARFLLSKDPGDMMSSFIT